MQFVGTRKVLELTGISSDQLREWTVRRDIIKPDFPPQKRGIEAKFSWQTVLVLRLAVVLKNQFCIQLSANREALSQARTSLKGKAFPALWGNTFAFYDSSHCELLSSYSPSQWERDAILLQLDPHLSVLATEFTLSEVSPQLPLFKAHLILSRASDIKARENSKGLRL